DINGVFVDPGIDLHAVTLAMAAIPDNNPDPAFVIGERFGPID
ncbi:hypothetical protein LCGC14_2973920, partial [marine sediment metagenome]